MLTWLRSLVSSPPSEGEVQAKLDELRDRLPVPVFWLLGKTQSGKSSVVRYLTGAEQAQIGNGFQPCTRFSRMYDFPSAESPLIRFLDTRGLEEPGYNPEEDLAQFSKQAHLLVVTLKVTDHAVEKLVETVAQIKRGARDLPVLLVLTCLHEAYPQQQHPQPYPFGSHGEFPSELPEMLQPLRDCVIEQRRRFAGLADRVILADLTLPEEGFNEANYGGPILRQAVQEMLPDALRRTLAQLDLAGSGLADLHERRALPYIMAYTSLATAAGALPIPLIDLVLVPGIQAKMVHALAQVYGQELAGRQFLEIASSMGLGMLARQAIRSVTKIIPFFGWAAAGALAGASTYALGRAFCYYYRNVHQGHIPNADDLRKYYENELARVQQQWMGGQTAASPTDQADRGGRA